MAAITRPKSLREVATDANSGRKTLAISIDEFLDTFYLGHPDKLKQQGMIDEYHAVRRTRTSALRNFPRLNPRLNANFSLGPF
jgi:hypothetical protein